MTALALILALAGPVATVTGDIPYIEMTATPEGYAVTFHNARIPKTPQPQIFTVGLDGIEVAVAVASLPDDDPDTMTVTPPPGWWCSPCAVTVGENQSATVWLFPQVMG